MSSLVDISKRIELTNEAMGRIGQMLQASPGSQGLLMNLSTLGRTQKNLKKEFREAAKRYGVEICTYRLIPEGTERHSITGIGKAFVNFQTLFSIVYEAVKVDKPRKSQHSGDEVSSETLLDYAYSFPGSVGVAFTVPTQASLYGNYFDQTIDALFAMARSQNSQDLKAFSRKLGVGPVRAMYRWACDLYRSGFGIDIHWKGSLAHNSRLYVQKGELQSLAESILATSEENHTMLTVEGILQGADVPARNFHFQYKDQKNRRKDIRGKFIDAIKADHPVTIPAKYKATIRRTTITNYSLEEDEVKDTLIKLEEIKIGKKKVR